MKNDEKSYENILIYDISCKTLFGVKLMCFMFYKVDGFIRHYNGTRYYYWTLKNMMSFSKGLDILYDEKVVFHVLILIIMQKSNLIQMMIWL